MKHLGILILLITPAFAQTQPDWSHGACYADGIYFPARAFGQCVTADKGAYAQTAPPANLLGAVTVTGPITSLSYSITNAVPDCPADRELVMRAGGTYGCAADVKPVEGR